MTAPRRKPPRGNRLAPATGQRAARQLDHADAPGRVRIIGGQYRRTPLAVRDATGLRPTPDRVRVTVFNWLGHLLGDLARTRALDLFAGTGALGFEMASRGAARVVLVEHQKNVVEALRAVRTRLQAESVEVLALDWRAALTRLAPERFDVIFLDPPFDTGLLAPAIEASRALLAPGGLLYAEGAQKLAAPQLDAWGLEAVRTGHAGVVYFQLLRVRAS